MYSTAKLVFEWDVNPFDRVGSDSRGPLASSVLGLRESDDFVYEWLSGLPTRAVVIVVCSYFYATPSKAYYCHRPATLFTPRLASITSPPGMLLGD